MQLLKQFVFADSILMKAFERHYTDDNELVNDIDGKDVCTKPKKLEFGKRKVCFITSHLMNP